METNGHVRQQAERLIDFLGRRGYSDFGKLLTCSRNRFESPRRHGGDLVCLNADLRPRDRNAGPLAHERASHIGSPRQGLNFPSGTVIQGGTRCACLNRRYATRRMDSTIKYRGLKATATGVAPLRGGGSREPPLGLRLSMRTGERRHTECAYY